MKNEKEVSILCPYCGAQNGYDNRTCIKCSNRIPQSARDEALKNTSKPVREIVIKKDNRRTIMPLRRKNDIPVAQEKEVELSETQKNVIINEQKPKIADVISNGIHNSKDENDLKVIIDEVLKNEQENRERIEDNKENKAQKVTVTDNIYEDEEMSEIVSIKTIEKPNDSLSEIVSIKDVPHKKTLIKDDLDVEDTSIDFITEYSRDNSDRDDIYRNNRDNKEDLAQNNVSEEIIEEAAHDTEEIEYVSYNYDEAPEEIELDDATIEQEDNHIEDHTTDEDEDGDFVSYNEDDFYGDEEENIPREYVDDVTVLLSDTIENVKAEMKQKDEFTSEFELNPNWDEKADKINIPLYIIRATMKPFNKFKKEEEKLFDARNVILLATVLIIIITIFGVFKTMLGVVRVTSFWTGETTWVWENLKDINYFKEIINQLIIYIGFVVGLSGVYYGASYVLKKDVKLVKIFAAVTTSFIPFVLTYGILSPVLSLIYEPLSLIVSVIGCVYSVVILMEIINDIVPIEDVNKRIYFHMICLALFFIVIVLLKYEADANVVKEELGIIRNLI